MLQLPADIRVFLSSTFVDLCDIRGEIARRLTEVLGTQLITMETFGSDDTPPDITSVRRVRECDIFIGIYARRSGSISPTTGKSITELELDEAERAYSAGIVAGLLLYVLDDDAPWPPKRVERDPVASTGLQRLRKRIYRHTVTRFRHEEDLPFYILRDLLVKARDRIGCIVPTVRSQTLPAEGQLHRPVGMEFLTSTERRYLVGRDDVMAGVFGTLTQAPLVLLLGNSGVGKTSFIHAGLLPHAVTKGWRVVYTRPFGLPSSDIVEQLQASVFEGRPTYRGPLLPLLGEIMAAVEEPGLLLIIDQFEDVLAAREPREIERLIADLRQVHALAEPHLRVLISYRADLEGRLGRYWQQISGAAQGLPRMYLSGIEIEDAWLSVQHTLDDLKVTLRLTPQDVVHIKQDLHTASLSVEPSHVYPPYVQMLIEHIWQRGQVASTSYQSQDYQGAGGMAGIIGSYLERQLAYAQDRTGHLRRLLVALVRSYGSKAQRSLAEIVADTGLTTAQCDEGLEQLIHLRLVRHLYVPDDAYEVAHDFLAHRILTELTDADEREFKRFRELLATKAAAFVITDVPLTVEEMLLLFKHKERVLPTEAEIRLLLASWIRHESPALYWLLAAPRTVLLPGIQVEASKEDLSRDQRAFLALLRWKVGGSPLGEDDYEAFHEYKLAAELSSLIAQDPPGLSDRVLMWALQHRRTEVRTAALEAVVRRLHNGDWSWIPRLRDSTSHARQWAYERLIIRADVPCPLEGTWGHDRRAFAEFTALKRLAQAQGPTEVRRYHRDLQALRPKRRSCFLAQGLAWVRSGRLPRLLRAVQRVAASHAAIFLAAIDGYLAPEQYSEMLAGYEQWNMLEAKQTSKVCRIKVEALAQAVLRANAPCHLRALRQTFTSVALTPSAHAIARALATYGSVDDVLLILDRVATYPHSIDYWPHMEVARTLARRMEDIATAIPPGLLRLVERQEFWEYIGRDAPRVSPQDLLPLQCRGNRPLYIRLAAYALIGAARQSDQSLLCRLAHHPYRLIARAATVRLVYFDGEAGLRALASTAVEAIKRGKAQQLAGALFDAEIAQKDFASLW